MFAGDAGDGDDAHTPGFGRRSRGTRRGLGGGVNRGASSTSRYSAPLAFVQSNKAAKAVEHRSEGGSGKTRPAMAFVAATQRHGDGDASATNSTTNGGHGSSSSSSNSGGGAPSEPGRRGSSSRPGLSKADFANLVASAVKKKKKVVQQASKKPAGAPGEAGGGAGAGGGGGGGGAGTGAGRGGLGSDVGPQKPDGFVDPAQAARLAAKQRAIKRDRAWGAFEKHTRGFGSKYVRTWVVPCVCVCPCVCPCVVGRWCVRVLCVWGGHCAPSTE